MRGEVYVCTSFNDTVAAGVRGEMTSENAINAATANATVVKKPKTFWMRTMEVCILAASALLVNSINLLAVISLDLGEYEKDIILCGRKERAMWPFWRIICSPRDIPNTSPCSLSLGPSHAKFWRIVG
jgi:hypothetical protein